MVQFQCCCWPMSRSRCRLAGLAIAFTRTGTQTGTGTGNGLCSGTGRYASSPCTPRTVVNTKTKNPIIKIDPLPFEHLLTIVTVLHVIDGHQ
eukprot:scaffold99669_cov21-Prasinocladus_malaysianus.AAC.2